MQDFIKVASTDELQPGAMKLVEVADERILLVNHEGRLYAWTEECTHAGGSLSEGDLNGNEVECPLHGSRFDVTTGEVTEGPADEALGRYAVRVSGKDVFVGPA